MEITERETAILEVEVTSDTADVSWQKDGEKIEELPDKFVIEKKGNLRKLLIRNTSVHDEGEYTCSLDEQECSSEVTVVELPPEIITKMNDQTIAKGEKATFEIELTKGDALVRWFKDDKELQFSEHVQLFIDGKRQKLKIYNSESSDAGIYSCQVGKQKSSARLTVEEPAVQFIKRLPSVTLVPVNTDAVFEVELNPDDVPVKWYKKGKEIKPSDKYVISSSGKTRKLIVKDATEDDETDYSVVAANVQSMSQLKTEMVGTPPKITPEQKEYKVKENDDVTLEVKFTGKPQPTDEWTVNGKVIKKSKKMSKTVTENSASLTIFKTQEEDEGNYTVKLTNPIGEDSTDIKVIFMSEYRHVFVSF